MLKNVSVKLMVLVTSIGLTSAGLVGCSTNTQKQNTGIGAVTGAVVGGLAGSAIGAGTGQVVAIGVGAVAGALIGGAIGHSMDSSDTTRVSNTLDNNPPNKATRWKNTKTGQRYVVVPTSKMITINGNPNCRTFRATTMMHGKKEVVKGAACRQSDGTWQTVSM